MNVTRSLDDHDRRALKQYLTMILNENKSINDDDHGKMLGVDPMKA